jgi:CheY-like chemotaxis protein
MLAVSDTGSGMTPDVKAHLFEPFFTTKEPGRGTGLGLAMVYGAVSQNGGRVEVDSEPGRGTSFRIYLPRAIEAETPAPPEAGGPLPRGTETILLVEDDAPVRSLAALLLVRQGYTVLPCASGLEAIEALGKTSGPVHLMITDVIMPGMNGRVLAQQVLLLRPGIRVLFASGYTSSLAADQGVLEKGVEVLSKPYTGESLARRVRDVLDKPAR